jgi:hypothetical protein
MLGYYFYRPWRIRVGVRLARPNVLWWEGGGGGMGQSFGKYPFYHPSICTEAASPSNFLFSFKHIRKLPPLYFYSFFYLTSLPFLLFVFKNTISRDCQEKTFFMSLFLFPVSNPLLLDFRNFKLFLKPHRDIAQTYVPRRCQRHRRQTSRQCY